MDELSAVAEVQTLPEEVLLKIFSYVDLPSLAKCACVCKDWAQTIKSTQTLWKQRSLALTDSKKRKDILDMKAGGSSWKEAFEQNHGSTRVRRLWLQGRFSNLREATTERTICPMSSEEWGKILELELER